MELIVLGATGTPNTTFFEQVNFSLEFSPKSGSTYLESVSYSQVGIVMDCHWVQSGHNSNMGIVTQNIANNSNIGNCEVLER